MTVSRDGLPYSLGALRSPEDARDYRVAAFLPEKAVKLPYVWDYTGYMQPVRDQGREGSCVGHATAGMIGYRERVTPSPAAPLNRILSPRDAYEGARSIIPVDGEGAYPRAALKYAQKTGICAEASWPYRAGETGAPAQDADASRAQNRLKTYSAVEHTPDEIMAALYFFGPLLVTLEATDGFMTPDPATRMVAHRGENHGGHAVVLCGFDRDKRCYTLQNSWGTGWGRDGFCLLPFDHPLIEAFSSTPALVAGGPPKPQTRSWLEQLLDGSLWR